MPIYEYDCPEHGRFELICTFDQFEDPGECPECGGTFPRALSLPSEPQGDFGTPKKKPGAYKMERYVDERLSGKHKGGALQQAIRETGHKPLTDTPEKLGLKGVRDTYN